MEDESRRRSRGRGSKLYNGSQLKICLLLGGLVGLLVA